MVILVLFIHSARTGCDRSLRLRPQSALGCRGLDIGVRVLSAVAEVRALLCFATATGWNQEFCLRVFRSQGHLLFTNHSVSPEKVFVYKISGNSAGEYLISFRGSNSMRILMQRRFSRLTICMIRIDHSPVPNSLDIIHILIELLDVFFGES